MDVQNMNNLDQYFSVRYQAMMRAYREDKDDEAFQAAEELLTDAELPIMYRARCHMMLSTNDENPFFLQHALEAVRILDEDCREAVLPEAFPDEQLQEARRLLEDAQTEAAHREEERNLQESKVEGDIENDVDEETDKDVYTTSEAPSLSQ